MPFVPVDGCKIWYDSAGESGPPALFVMGFAGRGTAWGPQIEGLRRGHRLAWMDNRGIGRSDRSVGVLSMRQMAADAVAVLDALGWAQAHVVGVSMGGMIAQEIALGHRERVRSLTLMATHAGGPTAFLPPMAGLGHFLSTWQISPKRRVEAMMKLLYPADYLERADREDIAARLGREFADDVSPATLLSQTAAVATHNTRARLHLLEGLPTLLVRPGRDILIDPRHIDELHKRIPGARLLHLPEAGHGFIYQCRDVVNKALMEHFAEAG